MKIDEARQYAADGGQALHMMTGQWARGYGGPKCFRDCTEFAHLFDQDAARLARTAASLGVRRVVVCKRGTPSQHVDLVGKPLRRAKSGAIQYE